MSSPSSFHRSTSNQPAHPIQIASPPLATPTSQQPTQILTFSIRPSARIEDVSTPDGETWNKALDIIQKYPGFRALYWGRNVEESDQDRVEVVVYRNKMSQHTSFLSSRPWLSLQQILEPLYESSSEKNVSVLHAQLQDFTSNARTLLNAPVTGTAIYTATSVHGWEKVWALWTTIVPEVKGCLGCTGGWVESLPQPPAEEGKSDGGEKKREGVREYVVYVGWESIQDHDAYHHTKDFARKRVILSLHNSGWRGYGHVRFAGSRVRCVEYNEEKSRKAKL
ncbi:hypothetical protein BDW74DRAFT_176037 [Aspergillus multicolor]|uniref:uncharacterized protein n=1 Tax=Aspergillus multicolor TaxID=41759 RepID=UPI003CCDB032